MTLIITQTKQQLEKMNSDLETLVKEAYEIAHDHNKNGHNTCYTRDEAIRYDPLISRLYEAVKILDSEVIQN